MPIPARILYALFDFLKLKMVPGNVPYGVSAFAIACKGKTTFIYYYILINHLTVVGSYLKVVYELQLIIIFHNVHKLWYPLHYCSFNPRLIKLKNE